MKLLCELAGKEKPRDYMPRNTTRNSCALGGGLVEVWLFEYGSVRRRWTAQCQRFFKPPTHSSMLTWRARQRIPYILLRCLYEVYRES